MNIRTEQHILEIASVQIRVNVSETEYCTFVHGVSSGSIADVNEANTALDWVHEIRDRQSHCKPVFFTFVAPAGVVIQSPRTSRSGILLPLQ